MGKKSLRLNRFKVCRDHDSLGRPEGWYVQDSRNKSVLRRFKFRKDAQALTDQANSGASKES